MSRIYLFVFAVYLLLGNSARVIPLPFLLNNVLITEFILYFFSVVYLLFNFSGVNLSKHPILLSFSGIAVAWSIIGVAINGFDLQALSYGVRMILQLITIYALSQSMRQYFTSPVLAVKAFCYISGIIALFGVGLLVAFPNSRDLWDKLSSYGIEFYGDPHSFRFISFYFDPNFYAVIASLPAMFALRFFLTDKRQVFWGCLALFLLGTIALSLSRSGIATAVACIMYVTGSQFAFNSRARIKIVFLFILIFVFGVMAVVFIQPLRESVTSIVERFSGLDSDESAAGRLVSFALGWGIFKENFWVGVGYNYVNKWITGAANFDGFVGVDSSILFTLANFGILGTCLISISLVVNSVSRIALTLSGVMRGCIEGFDIWFYILTVVVFASLFNNVVYYQFWFIPVGGLASYLFEYQSNKSGGVASRRELINRG